MPLSFKTQHNPNARSYHFDPNQCTYFYRFWGLHWFPKTPVPHDIHNYAIYIGLANRYDNNTPNSITADTFCDTLRQLAQQPWAPHVENLVLGTWLYDETNYDDWYGDGCDLVYTTLCDIAPKLPNLRRLYCGDVENELFRMELLDIGDISPVLNAYPNLQELALHGVPNRLEHLQKHTNLRVLRIESGGLSRNVLQDILRASLPSLETLTLWFGSDYYGADIQVDDLQPLLSGKLFPKLQTLGLANSEFADNLTPQLIGSPIFERITHLDLSLGTLSDQGLSPLLHTPWPTNLQSIDLRQNFLSPSAIAQLLSHTDAFLLTDNQKQHEDDGYRYVSVAE